MSQFINKVNKDYGEYTALSASDMMIPKRFTTGSLSADVIFGGGFPGNQWTEIRGKESSGKTSFVFKSISANQLIDPDFNTLWIAAETYDIDQSHALGVDNSRVTVVPTQAMELAFQIMTDGASSKEFDMIVLDSYPALVPDEEAEKMMDEFTTAMGARNMNKFIRKAGIATKRSPDGSERAMAGIIINQYRDKIGGFSRFGIPQTTPGGHGKDYFYYTILKVARDEWIEEKRPGIKDAVKVGQTIKLTTEKNKANAPQQTVSLDFYFRNAPVKGFKRGEYDVAKDYFTMAVMFGVIQKKGGWYYYNEEKWQGRDKVLESLYEDKALQDEIADQVLLVSKNPAESDNIPDNEEN